MTYDPSEHTIDEIHEHLAEHPEDTAAVLAAEQARGDDARVTLVSSLQNGQPAAAPTAEEGEPVEDIDAGFPTGEYPTEGTFGYAEPDVPTPQ
jgi:hypothetical protein